MESQFAVGIALTAFGVILIMMGVVLPDFLQLLVPVALVFIGGGIALKVISVKNLG